MKLCVCERRLWRGSAPGIDWAVEEDLRAAPVGDESAWKTVEQQGDGTTWSLCDGSVNNKKGMGGSMYGGEGFMVRAARVLSLSRVKIGEEDRVHCGLMVISVSVGLGDKIRLLGWAARRGVLAGEG
jgi:hypothetical protein